MKDDLKEHLSRQESFDRVVEIVSEWIQYYNTKRYQWQLAKLSPDQFYDYITTGNIRLRELSLPLSGWIVTRRSNSAGKFAANWEIPIGVSQCNH